MLPLIFKRNSYTLSSERMHRFCTSHPSFEIGFHMTISRGDTQKNQYWLPVVSSLTEQSADRFLANDQIYIVKLVYNNN